MRACSLCSKVEGEHEDPFILIKDPLDQEIPFEPNTPDPKLLIKRRHRIKVVTAHKPQLFHVYDRKLLCNILYSSSVNLEIL